MASVKNSNGEFRGTVREQIKNLSINIEKIDKTVESLPVLISEKIEIFIEEFRAYKNEHEIYHCENESRWGISKILRENIGRTIFVAVLITAALMTLFATGTVDPLIAAFLKRYLP
jgi:hypothetical protein